jgi:poly-gamma-glutamate synthesis protein (capsule biosynthesis protein)
MKRLRRIAASLVLVAGTAWAGDHSVSLIFAGDVMLDDGPGRLIADGGDPLAAVAPLLADADYRIANLECSVSTRGASLPGKPYTFRADPRALRVMQGRFDAVAVSNNHSGDFGPDAFLDTIDHLRQAGLRSFGGGRNLRDAHAPLWLHKNGLRIAVLGYNEYKPRSFEAGASRPGVAWSEDSEVISDIRAARKAGAHIVIPFMHWGWENRHTPSLRQRMLARNDATPAPACRRRPPMSSGCRAVSCKPMCTPGNFARRLRSARGARAGCCGWRSTGAASRPGKPAWCRSMPPARRYR